MNERAPLKPTDRVGLARHVRLQWEDAQQAWVVLYPKGNVKLKPSTPARPLWFLAELTYRCPLACPYCSNPLDYKNIRDELSTDEWRRVLSEARALGVTQLCFSGGEPLLRKDLEALVAHARQLGFYSQISTSGVGLNEKRLEAFREAGLDHMQLSFQAGTEQLNDYLGGATTFKVKQKMAQKGVRLLDAAQHRDPPFQYRADRADPRNGRGLGRGLCGAGQLPVLRLGDAQSRTAHAFQRAVGAC